MSMMNRFLDRTYDALASLRLAVVVMITLGTTCLLATLYESRHGTPAVQRDVYRTWWFALILCTLGVNIFCSMVKRWPWKAHHTGFVLAHIGILTLLAGSLVSLQFGMDGNMALYEGETGDRVALQDKALQVALPATQGTFPVVLERRPPGGGRERRFAIPDSDVTLVAEDFLPHVRVVDAYTEAPSGPPALHFLLDNPFMKQDGWLSTEEGKQRVDFGPVVVALAEARTEAEAHTLARAPAAGRNQITFVLGPGARLAYGLASRTGEVQDGLVTPGQPVLTPWMGMKVFVPEMLLHAAAHRTVAPEAPPAKDERRQPAVKVRLESPQGRSASEWVPWGETRPLLLAGAPAYVAYRAPEVAVPFKVTLERFKSDKYPGSSMAATYESFVRIEDPDQGVSEHHISMNHPLHYRGYIFFQASFVEGQPMMSVFSVARSPGLPLVYLGVVLLSAGVVWMFYLKPWLARRQAARALLAHRQREQAHAAPPSVPDPVPGPAGPAQPASSGI